MVRIQVKSAALAVLVCASSILTLAQAPAPTRPGLREELLRLERDDQAERVGFGDAVTGNDTAYLDKLMEADTRRLERLKTIVAADGWPTVALVGKDGVKAAWMILQHATDYAWQASMLPALERAAASGDVSQSDLAQLTDRVLVRSGRPQRYGNAFSIVDGRLVADPIDDAANVDARRAAIGLPPMAEYARVLGELMNLPVEWPPK